MASDSDIRMHVKFDERLTTKLVQKADQVGEKIRARRHALTMGQPELATALGVSSMAVQKYETGATALTPARLVAIADALKCETTDLIP